MRTKEGGRKESSFITLTYDAEHLPKDWGLHVSEWQDFAKRLRHLVGPFRYYMCGEYGEKNSRPHFHAILFGIDFAEERIPIGKNKQGNMKYITPTLMKAWKQGDSVLGTLTPQSAAYVAKYTIVKNYKAETDPRFNRTDGIKHWRVRPEFATMSLKPGIGAEWWKRWKKDLTNDFAMQGSRKARVPKYYDTLLERENPEELENIKKKRKQVALKRAQDLTAERLEARELILRKKQGER